MANSFSPNTDCNSCNNSKTPSGKRLFSNLTRDPASSITSIALSGKKRSAMNFSAKIAAASIALS